MSVGTMSEPMKSCPGCMFRYLYTLLSPPICGGGSIHVWETIYFLDISFLKMRQIGGIMERDWQEANRETLFPHIILYTLPNLDGNQESGLIRDTRTVGRVSKPRGGQRKEVIAGERATTDKTM